MQSWLMSQGTWRVLTKNYPVPRIVPRDQASTSTAKKPSTSQQETEEEEADETSNRGLKGHKMSPIGTIEKRKEDWEEQNSKAVGCIRLRLHHSISQRTWPENSTLLGHSTQRSQRVLWDSSRSSQGLLALVTTDRSSGFTKDESIQ
jgi:hypothetical protein